MQRPILFLRLGHHVLTVSHTAGWQAKVVATSYQQHSLDTIRLSSMVTMLLKLKTKLQGNKLFSENPRIFRPEGNVVVMFSLDPPVALTRLP